MNVKQGDLAIVVRSMANNEGKICRVLRFVGYYEFVNAPPCSDAWYVEFPRHVMTTAGLALTEGYVSDAWLRPISGIPDAETTDTPAKIEEPA